MPQSQHVNMQEMNAATTSSNTTTTTTTTTNQREKEINNEIKAVNKLKARHPLTKHSRVILPTVLQLIQNLHAMWNPMVSLINSFNSHFI
jgi:hypothetical protein